MNNAKYLGAIAGGIIAGAAIGILIAPCSGDETRSKLMTKGKKAQNDLTNFVNEGLDAWKSKYNGLVDYMKMDNNSINSVFSEIKKVFTKRNSDLNLDEIISEGKKSWYKANAEIKEGTNLTADQVDDMINHVFNKGASWFNKVSSKVKNISEEISDDVHDIAVDTKTSVKNTINEVKGAYDKAVS